jgi:hypothetical protein
LKGGENIKYFIVDYITQGGDNEYTEYGVLSAPTYESAEKKVIKGVKFFTRGEWKEFCEFDAIQEIPKVDFEVLQKYFPKI